MNEQIEVKPIKRYECINCGQLTTISLESDIKTLRPCCPSQSLKLLLFEDDGRIQKIIGESYENIINTLKYYVDLPEKYYKFLGVWIVGTYFHDCFSTYPIVYFNAMKGSAKTRTSKLTNYLCKHGDGKVTNNPTEAVLFRHPRGVVMSLDEMERLGNKEMLNIRELLNSVYKKGSKIQRMKKTIEKTKEEKMVAETFEPYFPLTIANIFGLEEVLEDRAFTLILEKSNDPLYTAIIEDWDMRSEILKLKRTLEQISDVSDVTLRKKTYITSWNDFIKSSLSSSSSSSSSSSLSSPQDNNKEKDELNELLEKEELFLKLYGAGIVGRNLELSFPLLMIANFISKETFNEALTIIKEMVIEKKADEYMESKDVLLYNYVSTCNLTTFEFISLKKFTSDFKQYLNEDLDWINEKWTSRALKRLNLVLEKKKTNSGILLTLNILKAKDKLNIFKKEIKHE